MEKKILQQSNINHYHLQVQANPKKMAQKTDATFASMGKTGLSHDIFLTLLYQGAIFKILLYSCK